MRILVVGTNAPTKEYPTNGIFEYNQAKALHNAGHEVVYAAVDIRSIRRRRPLGIQSNVRDGFPSYVISLPIGRLPWPLKQKAIHKKATYLGLRILFAYIYRKRQSPQLIHSHFLLVGSAVAELSRARNIPHIHTEHSSDLMLTPWKKTIRALAFETYHNSKRVIAVSPALAERIQDETGVVCSIVPNIVETSLFYDNRTSHSGFNVVTVGNLIPLKQMDKTIRAFAQSIGHFDSTSLTVIGDGPELQSLKDLAKTLGLSKKIHFSGKRDQQYIAEQFSTSDLFVLASRKETFGVVYIEALASGLPVIATKSGGPEHFLTENNSITVEPDDLQGLADAILAVYTEEVYIDTKASSREVKKLFGPEAISEQLTTLYEEVVDEVRK